MNKKTLWIARISIVAALYVALTLISYPFSFNYIQIRIAECLMIFVLFDKKYIISLTIGCLISNIFSFIALDFIFGTISTLLSCFLILLIKNKRISLLIPVIINGLIIGYELFITTKISFLLCVIYVMFGEFISCFVLGNIIYSFIIKNKEIITKITD